MKTLLLSLLFLQGVCFAGLPISDRQVSTLNVLSAQLRKVATVSELDQYAVEVEAEFSNPCWAPTPQEVPEHVLFNVKDDSNDAIEVDVYRSYTARNCAQVFDPYKTQIEIRSVYWPKGQRPKVIVNGVLASVIH